MSASVHPVLENMLQLGCGSTNAVSLAFQVYMELSEVRGCYDVQYAYNPEIDIIYLISKDFKSQDNSEIVVPISAFKSVSPARLNQLTSVLCQGCTKQAITLAFKDSDSSIFFYKVCEGLEEPMSPEESQQLKIVEERRRLLEADLRKRRDELYETAKADSEEL